LTRETGIVANFYFRNREALDFEQRGQEPVHALEKFQVGDAFALEGPVRAAGVGNLLAGEPLRTQLAMREEATRMK
jgi:hypothetical protein